VKRATVAYDDLQALAEGDARQPAPYDYAQFMRRRDAGAVALHASRARLGRITALAASLSVMLLGTALWRQTGPGPVAVPRPVSQVVAGLIEDGSPALVSVGQLAARDSIEERIALIDAMLSESRVAGAQDDSLRAMEQGRTTLVESLQRVAYAHQLVGP
jgi:hypothetical protein